MLFLFLEYFSFCLSLSFPLKLSLSFIVSSNEPSEGSFFCDPIAHHVYQCSRRPYCIEMAYVIVFPSRQTERRNISLAQSCISSWKNSSMPCVPIWVSEPCYHWFVEVYAANPITLFLPNFHSFSLSLLASSLISWWWLLTNWIWILSFWSWTCLSLGSDF